MTRTINSWGKALRLLTFAIAVAVLAAVSAPSPASATSLTIEAGSQISFGAIDMEYAGAGCSVTGATLTCPDWDVFGGWISSVAIDADIDSFAEGQHLELSLMDVEFPSGCEITFDGPFEIDYIAETVYYAVVAAGAYSFTACTPTEEGIWQGELGASPSSESFEFVFFIDPPPATVDVTVEDGSSLDLVGSSLDFDLELDTDCVDTVLDLAPAVVAPWKCPDWSGIEGTSTGVEVSADELEVDDGVVATLGEGSSSIEIAMGSCVITLDGDREFDYAGGTDSYLLDDVVGVYTLAGCTPLEALLIDSELGSSPSAQPFVGELLLDVTPS